jgi:NAD(P)-dependent dehydrogenase (short-subunit alcohol dehydrogenase family)
LKGPSRNVIRYRATGKKEVGYGTVEEIAGMVAYLASPEAAYIKGVSLMIDGGFSA